MAENRRTRRPPDREKRPNRPGTISLPPTEPSSGVRLQKALAAAGLGSRREIELWIEAGRVSVDGRLARLGDRVTNGSEVRVDAKVVEWRTVTDRLPRVLLYNKPTGEVVTRRDPAGRPTVFERLPVLKSGKWVSVGRLDIDSAGLLLLTDSGDLANRLMHPRHGFEREYQVRVQGELKPRERAQLLRGVELEDGPAAFTRIVDGAGGSGTGSNRWYRVVIGEGRNREVRRMFAAVGLRVSRLIRTRYGPVVLPRGLDAGRWRELDQRVVAELLGADTAANASGD